MFIPCYRITSEGLFFGIDMETKQTLYKEYSEAVPMAYGGIAYYDDRKMMTNEDREQTVKYVENLSLEPEMKVPFLGLPYLLVPYCDKEHKIALIVTVEYIKMDSNSNVPLFNTHMFSYDSNEDFNNKVREIIEWTQKTYQMWCWYLNSALLYYYDEGYDTYICHGQNTTDIPYHRLLEYAVNVDLTEELKRTKRSIFLLGGAAYTVVLKNKGTLDEAKHFSPVLAVEGSDISAVMVRYTLQSGYTIVNHQGGDNSHMRIGYVALRPDDVPYANYELYDNMVQTMYLSIESFVGRGKDNDTRILELNSEYYPLELTIATEPPIGTSKPCKYIFDLRKCKYIRKCVIRAHFSYTADVSTGVIDLRGCYCDSLYVAYIAQFDTLRLASDTYMLRDRVLPNMHFLPLHDVDAALYGNAKIHESPHRDRQVYVPYKGGINRELLKSYQIPDNIIEGYESSQVLGKVDGACGLVQVKHIEVTITRNFTAEDLRLCAWTISYETCTVFYDSRVISRETVNLFSTYLWSSRTELGSAGNAEFTLIDTAGIYPPSDSVKLVI